MGQNSLGGAADLRPDENEIYATRKAAAQRKYRILTSLIAALLVVAIIALLLTQCGGPAIPKQLEWSEWMDTLPDYATEEHYLIENQKLYRSRNLENTTSVEQSSIPGWELYDTVEGNGDFGEWTDWLTTEVSASDSREVETQTRYRYRDKETTTSASGSMPGWEKFDTTYTWGEYGGWSNWSSSTASESESRDVETKTQYRYRTKSYTSSSSSTLNGWTRYDSSTSYGSWSGWSDSAISSSSTREVETRQVQTGTRYYIAHYCTGNTGDSNKYKSASWKYDDRCSYHELGWFDSLDAFEVDGKQVTYYKNGSKYRCSNTCFYFFIMDTQNTYKTQYRSRSISTTYYFYQWGGWSSYSDTFVSSNNDREVSTRTLYRYRDRQSIPTYHFFRWGSWSDWSPNAITASDSKQVETKPYYRYRDRMLVTTYYFKRWGSWSDWSTTSVSSNETTEVEAKMQYRYKSK